MKRKKADIPDARFPILEIRNVKKHFSVKSEGLLQPPQKVKAVDGVSLSVYPGDCFGIVGESGCGKTTLGRAMLMLDPPSEGDILFEGKSITEFKDAELRGVRREVQVIFQDPFSSLNPRMTVEQIVAEPMLIHRTVPTAEGRRRKVAQLLEKVGLQRGQMSRFPHEFSGGQRQRVGIARALALNPKLIIADEPVSALDVSIQAQILNLLKDLQEEFRLTYVFISHDFSVVRHLCNRVGVMYLGKAVETAATETLFSSPQHPYTEALLSAVPIPDPAVEGMRKRILLEGDLPSPLDPPSGCAFHPRCRYAEKVCGVESPPLEEVGDHHWAACPIRPFEKKPSEAAIPHT